MATTGRETTTAPGAALAARGRVGVLAKRLARVFSGERALFALSLVGAAALATIFYNKSLWSADDGAYAYIAERLLSGDVLFRDVRDFHPGYIHFLNAAAMGVFGVDLVSMRYPLALGSVAQAGLVFAAMRRCGAKPALAVLGALAGAAFGFILFSNPTPNWYAAFLTAAAIYVASRKDWALPRRELALGLLAGAIFLLRQPTGVFVAFGIVFLVLMERTQRAPHEGARAGSGLLLLLALVLAAFVARTGNIFGVLAFGVWPVGVLAAGALRVRVGAGALAASLARLFAGAAIAALPLAAYVIANGVAVQFLHDVFIAPLSLVAMPFFDKASYAYLFVVNLHGLMEGRPEALVLLAFWGVVFAAPVMLGVAAINRTLNGSVSPIIALPVFHALIAMHYEIPIYAYFATGLVLAGAVVAARGSRVRRGVCAAIIGAAAVAVFTQAGQPATRSYVDTAAGVREAQTAFGLSKASVYMPKEQQAELRGVANLIQACTLPGERIIAAPLDADFYFLSGRDSAIPFFAPTFALQTQDDLARLRERLLAFDAPPVVAYRPGDKYETPLIAGMMQTVVKRYVLAGTSGGVEIYVSPWRAGRAMCPKGEAS